MNVIGSFHTAYVHSRRVRVLSEHFAELIAPNAHVLDVGCGDGLLAFLIMQKRRDVEIHGVDTLVRSHTRIPVLQFDGKTLPCTSDSVDVVTFVDVLHHTVDPMTLLREGARAARRAIVVKDHICNGLIDRLTLRFMDRIGNAHHGVALPYTYWSQQMWFDAFAALDLRVGIWRQHLGLYPRPATRIFERSLHFITLLKLR